MKNIAKSLAIIAGVAAIVTVGTIAFFSDTEKSVNNKFTAGTIDISVDGQNPWTNSWSNILDKPCQTDYMTFVIENVGVNPANIWKRLTDVVNGPGTAHYHEASSEPEWEAGGGVGGTYVERDNLSAFMIYDMSICRVGNGETQDTVCPLINVEGATEHKKPGVSANWVVLIDENDQVRVDNVVDTWISLTEDLKPGEKLVVSQSYHLMTWDDSGQPMVTNWAQGDTMEFDVELEARQLTAPAPGVNQANQATVQFVQKDATTWEEIATPQGSLTYNIEGEEFVYDISVTGLVDGTNYSLIYYADGWPGNNPGALIANYTATSGTINDTSVSVELDLDLPDPADANHGVGAKLWIVLANDYSVDQMIAWNPSSYLFDKGLVNYNDTQVN